MKRFQIRQEVLRILRDDTYPKESVNAALNRVLANINNMGRFRFHQSSADVTTIIGTWQYAIPDTIQDEHMVVYDPQGSSEKVLLAETIKDGIPSGKYGNTPYGTPTTYSRWGNQIWLDPTPDTASKTVRLYTWTDLPLMTDDQAEPDRLPERYHVPILAYGAAAEICPNLKMGQRGRTIFAIYENNIQNMRKQELWDHNFIPAMKRSIRFNNFHDVGHVSVLR